MDDGMDACTLFGGQGDDSIVSLTHNSFSDVLYGDLGEDTLGSVNSILDTFFGGQGNDDIFVDNSINDVLYGNQGNDVLGADTSTGLMAFGGQGNDFIDMGAASAHDALYGNQGNDFLADIDAAGFNAATSGHSGAAEGTSTLYGGQGHDILDALGAGGDTLYGGLGNDIFAANDEFDTFEPGVSLFTTNDMVTVADFHSGQDSLAMSTLVGAQDSSSRGPGFLTKESVSGDVNSAFTAATSYFGADTSPAQFLFVYGGSGAGYLFYNGDNGGINVEDGMTLVGDNGETSVSANDIVQSFYAA